MKALVLTDYNVLVLQEMPVPDIGRDEVLVRVKACAICGSDIHGMDGSTGRRIPPIVMGHEAAGIIEAAGSDVVRYRAGDRVTFDSTVFCNQCDHCRRGEVNLCDNRKVMGVSCSDYRLNGAFADYIALPQHILYPLPESLSFVKAAMAEPLSIALHAVGRTPVLPQMSVVVIGAGMIGLLIIQLLKISGCKRIIAVDLDPGKRIMAARFGATDTLEADPVFVGKAVRDLTEGRGADAAFEAVGLAPTVNMALAALRKGGVLILVGNLAPSVDMPLQNIVTRQITLSGSCASAGEYPESLDLIASDRVDVDSFISAVAPLSEGAMWFKRLYAGGSGLMKVILTP